MGVLNDVLRWKEYKDQEQAASMNAIPQAVQAFITGKQQQQENMINMLKVDATLAASGLKRTENGFVRDESLLSGDDVLKRRQADLLGQFMGGGQVGGVNQGNLPPGTSMNIGGLDIPLNPKLSESESSSVSGVQALEPIINDIESLVGEKDDKGNLIGFSESDKGIVGDIKRTAEQLAVDSSVPLLVSKSKRLSELQSKFATLKKTLPFTEGGKQLTTTEKKQVFALLNVTGKDDARIEKDINEAMSILRNKEKIALGGASAAKENKQKTKSLIPDGTQGTYKGQKVVRKGGKWIPA